MKIPTRVQLRSTGIAALMAVIAGCGGGGGSSDPIVAVPPPPAPAPAPVNWGVFPSAAVVIGQADFDDSGGGSTLSRLDQPVGTPSVTADGRLFVLDEGNNRLLAFRDYDQSSSGRAAGLELPAFALGVSSGGGKLMLVGLDGVRIFNSAPSDAGARPSVTGEEDQFRCKADATLQAQGVFMTPKGKLLVADTQASRVLIWNSVPEAGPLGNAHVAVGQANRTTCTGSDASQGTLAFPRGVWSDDDRLIVTDSGNNRVLIWNKLPTEDGQLADVVLGQSNFTNSDLQPASAATLTPSGIDVSDTGQLAIVDEENHRILIWNSIPTRNSQPADQVIGQNDFIKSLENDVNQNGLEDDVGASASTLASPRGVRFHGRNLIVTDGGNNRILVFRAVN